MSSVIISDFGDEEEPSMARGKSDSHYKRKASPAAKGGRMNPNDSPLQAAKDKLSIPLLAAMLFPDWKPSKSCRCPWREDRSPSFSVYEDGHRWKDHGTGEGGDVVDFLAMASGCSLGEASKRLIEMAGVMPKPTKKRNQVSADYSHDAEDAQRKAKRKGWPQFESPNDTEIQAIASLRGLTDDGVRSAVRNGLLYCANSQYEGRSWIITDLSRRNAQGRLLSGQPWKAGMKAKTLPGAEASWPIGLPIDPAIQFVALCEGGPDLLAAYDMAWRLGVGDILAPVAMMGASNRIPQEAIPLFAGKHVRIFGHCDKAGEKAVATWGAQLIEAGVEVDRYSFERLTQADGSPVEDLNHFLLMDPTKMREHAIVAFDFAIPDSFMDVLRKLNQQPAPVITEA